MSLDDNARVGAHRGEYFKKNGFSEAGYSDAWVRVQLGPVPLWIPNTSGRKRIVPLHDLHHLITGYDTNLVGEGEIGAWELASGCKRHIPAWVLNLSAMAIGLVLSPRRVFRAFRRGRRSGNLYGERYDESMLEPSLHGLKASLPTRERGLASDCLWFFLTILLMTGPWIILVFVLLS